MFILICIIVGLAAFLAGVVIALFNSLIHARTMVQEAWSGVDVQLKRRYDLIPNLVEIVKVYAGHERQTLDEVTVLRAQAVAGGSLALPERTALESGIARSLKNILAVAEVYPDLKANQHFLQLQNDLVAVEDEIQLARRYYNGSVRDLNVLVQSFPSNLFASFFGFQSKEFFELNSVVERAVPGVVM